MTEIKGDGSLCATNIDNIPPFSTIICTGDGPGTNGKHCKGDSGGYLGVKIGTGEHLIVGVTSFSFACGTPHGYTSVSAFYTWIFWTMHV